MIDKLDVLREIGSISAAHGSIALSEILKRKIMLKVPKTEMISAEAIEQKIDFDKVGVAVYSEIITGLSGKVIFILDEKDAFKLNSISYKLKTDEKRSGLMTEMGMSLIKEVGSMVSSAYVNAMGMMFKRIVLLGVPSLISGTMREILNITVFSSHEMKDNQVLLVDAIFEEPIEKIVGNFYLILTKKAAREVRQLCEQILKDLKK
ncbi:MAG: chemotaxis protein CheC [Candidatus Omnitrophica bacterium]|nr:chemotaxis protein CheC [Candidatus Omnitrophota bacterium]